MAVRHGFAPRDAELGVAGQGMSPGLRKMTARAAAAITARQVIPLPPPAPARWTQAGATGILTLRCLQASDRWEENPHPALPDTSSLSRSGSAGTTRPPRSGQVSGQSPTFMSHTYAYSLALVPSGMQSTFRVER